MFFDPFLSVKSEYIYRAFSVTGVKARRRDNAYIAVESDGKAEQVSFRGIGRYKLLFQYPVGIIITEYICTARLVPIVITGTDYADIGAYIDRVTEPLALGLVGGKQLCLPVPVLSVKSVYVSASRVFEIVIVQVGPDNTGLVVDRNGMSEIIDGFAVRRNYLCLLNLFVRVFEAEYIYRAGRVTVIVVASCTYDTQILVDGNRTAERIAR